jgi:hypothetical protein
MFNDSWEHWFIDMNSKGYLESPNYGPFLVSDYLYYLPGGYSTTKENMRFIIDMIDHIGTRVTKETLYAIPANWNCNSSWADEDTGIPEYNITRHQYN